jgi:creatinine amidohydrolase
MVKSTGEPFHRYWQDWTTAELSETDAGRLIAVLPVASIEQHGPHLPLSTDTIINQAIVSRAVAIMPTDVPAVILPTQAVGLSPEHQSFPGTLTINPTTLSSVWTEIGDSLARAGVRKMLIFNSHGGQPQIMDSVARDLRVRHSMLAAHVSWFDFGLPEGLFDANEETHGIHGGAIETSMMLHIQPDTVRLSALAEFPTASTQMERDFRRLGPFGPVAFGWMSEDLNREGAMGNAAAASADKGAQIVDHAARCLVESLQEIDRFQPDFIAGR